MKRRFEIGARVASVCAAMIGKLVMIGWLFDIEALRFVGPALRHMSFNTSVLVVLIGVTVAVVGPGHARWRSLAMTITGGLSLAMSLTVLAEYALNRDLGVDRALHRQDQWVLTDTPIGRMAQPSAVGFGFIGLAMITGGLRAGCRRSQFFGAAAGVIAVVTLLSYVYAVDPLFHISDVPMSLASAFSLCLLSIGFLLSQPEAGWMSRVTRQTNAGAVARRLLPAALLLPIALGYLRVLGERYGYYGANLGVALLVVSVILLFTAAVVWSVNRLDEWEQAREHAARAIRESEERFDLAARATTDAIWDWNITTNALRWNKGDRPLFGHEPSAVGHGISWWSEQLHPEDRQRVVAGMHKVIQDGGTFWRAEYRFRRADGSYAEVLDRGYVARDTAGVAVRMIGAMQDLSEAKRAEHALRASEARERMRAEQLTRVVRSRDNVLAQLNALLANAPVGFAFFDREHRFVRVNEFLASRFNGLAVNAHVGRHISELMPANFQPIEALLDRVFATGQPIADVEVSGETTSSPGRRRYWLTAWFPVRTTNGETPWVGAALMEITRHKQVEQQLASAREALASVNEQLEKKVSVRTQELEETIRELEAFSYSLIHDLRAPLRAMNTYGNALEEEIGSAMLPQTREYIRRIKVAAQRMDHLITDSFNYSKLVRHELPLGPVHLGKLLHDMVESYPNLQEPSADVSIEIDDLVVWGNEAALTQVFSNLLGNAVKFVAPGVKPRVRVRAESIGDMTTEPMPRVIVWVEDNGIGIHREGHARIFEMFQRMHRADEYPGTGIGLAIVRKCVERVGGRVTVESAPGRGSRFGVELSVAVDVPATASSEESA